MIKKIIITISFFTGLLISSTVIAENDLDVKYEIIDNTNNIHGIKKFEDGVDYKIKYFFSYGCPFCYDFENYKEYFLKNKPDNIVLEHIPLTVISAWSNYTKAYFIAKSLNIDIRSDIFQKVHIHGEKILTKLQLKNYFLNNYDVSETEFEKRYNSIVYEYKERKYEKIANEFEVTGTPSMLIIDKNLNIYKTSPSISGNMKNMMASTIYIVRQQFEK